ncbi:hypothetical protein TNCV_4444531 [Trichonephila clavipes]|nr:hypothetical protein TNCV_4444531 [Trichonephila clavipes]
MRAIDDGPRNFEPRSSGEDETFAGTSLSFLPHHSNRRTLRLDRSPKLQGPNMCKQNIVKWRGEPKKVLQRTFIEGPLRTSYASALQGRKVKQPIWPSPTRQPASSRQWPSGPGALKWGMKNCNLEWRKSAFDAFKREEGAEWTNLWFSLEMRP